MIKAFKTHATNSPFCKIVKNETHAGANTCILLLFDSQLEKFVELGLI